MPLLFVYGTLKRGCKNHSQLADQRWVGSAQTQPGFRLYDLGDYPGLVTNPQGQSGILGELWEVDDKALRALDVFEGTAEGYYQRTPIPMQPPYDKMKVYGYLYLKSVQHQPALDLEWCE